MDDDNLILKKRKSSINFSDHIKNEDLSLKMELKARIKNFNEYNTDIMIYAMDFIQKEFIQKRIEIHEHLPDDVKALKYSILPQLLYLKMKIGEVNITPFYKFYAKIFIQCLDFSIAFSQKHDYMTNKDFVQIVSQFISDFSLQDSLDIPSDEDLKDEWITMHLKMDKSYKSLKDTIEQLFREYYIK
jgi:hypothetical protein